MTLVGRAHYFLLLHELDLLTDVIIAKRFFVQIRIDKQRICFDNTCIAHVATSSEIATTLVFVCQFALHLTYLPFCNTIGNETLCFC